MRVAIGIRFACRNYRQARRNSFEELLRRRSLAAVMSDFQEVGLQWLAGGDEFLFCLAFNVAGKKERFVCELQPDHKRVVVLRLRCILGIRNVRPKDATLHAIPSEVFAAVLVNHGDALDVSKFFERRECRAFDVPADP